MSLVILELYINGVPLRGKATLSMAFIQCGSDFLKAESSLVSVSFGHSPLPLNSSFFVFFSLWFLFSGDLIWYKLLCHCQNYNLELLKIPQSCLAHSPIGLQKYWFFVSLFGLVAFLFIFFPHHFCIYSCPSYTPLTLSSDQLLSLLQVSL